MAGTKLSDYRMSIFINNDQAKRSLMEMEKVMIGYEEELRNIERENGKDSQQYRDKKKVYDDHIRKMEEVRKQAGLNALSVKELRHLQSQLNNEMARAVPGSAHRQKLQVEFDAVSHRLKELTVKSKDAGFSFGRLADGFNKYFAIATAGMAAMAGFAFSIKNLITAQGELDDSLANIRKTTQMTGEEVQELNKQLGKIDTRTSRQELREMAVVAGQIGIKKNEVLDFVDSVDKLNVALGDEIQGGAEEVAKTMGTLRNVLTDMKSKDIADDMLRIGNAINELGAAGFATAPVIADFSNRIGGIGIPLGLTSDQVLGLSATLQELNVSTERGGTAVTKILQKMTTNTADFAKVAGMPVKEFTDLVNRDLFGAFTKVMEGSKQGGQSATLLAGIIKELEVSGAGASEVFAKLSNNTGMLREKVDLAGASLQNTDSIMNEFNIKNATLGAVLAKLSKEFYSLITMPGITGFFKNQVYHVVELVNWFKNLPQFVERYKVAIIALTGITLAWISAKTLSIQKSLLNIILLKEGILLKTKDTIVLGYLIAKEQLLTIWKGNGTAATKLATTAQLLWNAAIKANPIGALITVITAVAGAIALYERNSARAIQLDNQKASMTVLLADVNNKLKKSYSSVADQMRKIHLLSIDEKQDLLDTTNAKIREAEAQLLLMEAKQKAIGKESAKPTGWQNIKAHTEVGPAKDKALEYYSWANQKEAMEPFEDGIKQLKDGIDKLKTEKQNIAGIINAESEGDKILGKLAPQLEEKLARYQVALRNTVVDSEDYIRVQRKIGAVNKELSAFNTPPPPSYNDNLKAAKGYSDDLVEVRKKLQEATILLIKNEQERELKMNELDFQRKMDSISGMSSEEMQLREAYWLQKVDKENQINKKYSSEAIAQAVKTEEKKWKDIINADIKGSENWLSNSLELLKKQEAIELAQTELTEQEKTDIVDKYALKRAAVLAEKLPATDDGSGSAQSGGSMVQRSGADEPGLDFGQRTDALQLQRDKELEIAQGNADAQTAIWQEYYASMQGLIAAKIDQYAGYASQVISALSGVNQAMSDYESAQLQKDENANEKKKANLKKRLDAGQISQKVYNSQVEKLDADLDEKKKELSIKQAKRQKALSLAQAIINVAQAVSSALTAGPIIGIILAALVGILGAIQIGYIASTPIPEAAKGRYAAFREARQAAVGRYSVLGKDDQKLYRDVPYLPEPESGVYSTPTLFAETGREIILNPKHTENLIRFRPDLVYQIMQVPQRAEGSYSQTKPSGTAQTQQISVSLDKDTLLALEKFRESLSKPLVANMVYDTMIDSISKVQYIENETTR